MPTPRLAAPATRLDDPARLAALRASGLFAGVGAPALDRLARLAARVIGVPTALVSLVGDEDQRFPGMFGLDGWVSERRGTPLCYSFCQHVVEDEAAFVIDDAAAHPRLHAHDAVRELGVVAYAGVPLRTADGHVLGALCAVDTTPHAWTAEQLETLEELASAAMSEIELCLQAARLEERSAAIAATTEGIVIVDAAGTVTYANDACARIHGYAGADAMIGVTAAELAYPEAARFAEDGDIGRLLAAEGSWQGRTIGRRRSGSTFPVALGITRMPHGGHVVVARDVTAEDALESEREAFEAELARSNAELAASEARLTLALETSGMAWWTFDLDTGAAQWAPGLGPIYGEPEGFQPPDAAWAASRVLEEDRAAVHAAVLRGAETGEPIDHQARIVRADGQVRWTHTYARKISPVRMLGVVRDVTADRNLHDALERSERQFRSLVESAGSVVVGLREDFTVIEWNREAAALYGVEREAALGTDFLARCVPPELHDAVREGMRGVVEGTPVHDVEDAVTDPSGERRHIAWSIAPMPSVDGGPRCVIATAHDITARRRAERAVRHQQAYMRAVLDLVPSVVFGVDAEGRYTVANRMMGEVFGVEPEAVIGRTNADFIGAEAAAPFDAQNAEVLRTGVTLHLGEERVMRADGERWYMTTKALLQAPGSGEPHVVGVATDITAMRQAREDAERANRAKSDFLARMSHELRTPLTAIIGFSNYLERQLGGRPGVTDQERTYLGRVARSGRHLLGLINDILDLSKIEAGHMQVTMAATDVVALVQDVALQLEAQARPGVALRVELPATPVPPLSTDDLKLRQVLLNLLSNALKFTERGSVTVAVVTTPGGAVRALEVRDTGIGIAPERQAAVFDAFEQAEATTTRRYGGTGLGLSISRTLCHLLDADLTLASEPGVGSTFRVAFRSAG